MAAHRAARGHTPTSARRRSPCARPAPPESTAPPGGHKPAFSGLSRQAPPARPGTGQARCRQPTPAPAATPGETRPPAAPPAPRSPRTRPAPSPQRAGRRHGSFGRASASVSNGPPPQRYTTAPAPQILRAKTTTSTARAQRPRDGTFTTSGIGSYMIGNRTRETATKLDRVITRFITRSPRCPPLPSRACQVIRLGAGLVLRSGGQPSPDAAIAAGLLARARAGLPVLDDIEPAPLPHACALRGLIGRIVLLSLPGGKRRRPRQLRPRPRGP